ENHGVIAGLVAASALLIDYVLTVAVSTAAGVAAISSFVPELHDYRVVAGLALIALLVIGNLRGVREAGLLFAGPTYAYMIAMYGLVAFGLFRVFTGDPPAPVTPPNPFPQAGTGQQHDDEGDRGGGYSLLLHRSDHDGGHPVACREHRLHRIPPAGVGPRERPLHASPFRGCRITPGFQLRDHRPCVARLRDPRRFPRQRLESGPAIHARRVPCVHPVAIRT